MKIPWQLHMIALIVVMVTLSAETAYLFQGVKTTIPDGLAGRILGTLDAALLLVLSYYFTASITHSRARSSDAPAPEPSKGTS